MNGTKENPYNVDDMDDDYSIAYSIDDSVRGLSSEDLIEEVRRRGEMKFVLGMLSDTEIVSEATVRELDDRILEEMDDTDLQAFVTGRGLYPLVQARTSRLVHELRRQGRFYSVEEYYINPKVKGQAHCSDKISADVNEHDGDSKTATVTFKARDIYDYSEGHSGFK